MTLLFQHHAIFSIVLFLVSSVSLSPSAIVRKNLSQRYPRTSNHAFGITHGLSYLHHDCVPVAQIIHCHQIRSEFEPIIGDFGAAKLVYDPHSSSTRSAIVGTLGYLPENAYSTRLTENCEVYSSRAILLEILCRKLPVDPCFQDDLDIVSWTRKNLQENE